ncbi:MAG: hypothetical protein ACX94B_14300 [Henriciella sp.]
MSRRFLLLSGGAFVISVSLILLTAFGVGADPFHPRSRHIWALSLVAAAYASVRAAMVIGKFLDARNGEGESVLHGLFGKKEHAIDRRLAERRARLEAANKRAKQIDETNKETGDE